MRLNWNALQMQKRAHSELLKMSKPIGLEYLEKTQNNTDCEMRPDREKSRWRANYQRRICRRLHELEKFSKKHNLKLLIKVVKSLREALDKWKSLMNLRQLKYTNKNNKKIKPLWSADREGELSNLNDNSKERLWPKKGELINKGQKPKPQKKKQENNEED